MTQSNLLSPEKITEAPQDKMAKTFRVALIMLAAAFSVEAFYLFLAFQMGAWQMYALAGVIAFFCILNIIALPVIRRGHIEAGSWLMVAGMLLIFPAASALIADIGFIFGGALFLLTTLVASQTLPANQARIAIAASVVFGFLAAILDYLGLDYRLFVPEIQVFIPAITVVLLIVFGYFGIRQAWSGNIRVKLVASFTVIALVSVSILATVIFINYQNRLREDIRQRLLDIVSIAALQQDGDLHAQLQKRGDEESDAYRQIKATNLAIISTDADIAYLYTMRMDAQGNIYFVVDTGPEGSETQPLLDLYPDAGPKLVENFATITAPIVEDDFYSDEDGTFLSAYAPFYRSDGTLEGVIGLDVSADSVLAQERALFLLILGTALGALLLAILVGIFLGNLVVAPIINLSQVARRITEGDLEARATVQTTDEVGELADTFNLMVSQLKGLFTTLEQRVADRTRGLELAAEVGRSVSRVRALDEMLRDAAEIIRAQFDLYYVQVYLLDASQANLVLQSGTGAVGEQLVNRGHRLPMNTASLNGRAAIDKRSIVVFDTTDSPTFRPNPLLPETRSEMAIPLLLGDRVVGVLDLQSAQANALSNDNLSAFEALAGQLAVAVQNASLLEQAQEARAEVEAQARRLVRSNWQEHLDALHRPEQTGFVFERNQVKALDAASELSNEDNQDSLSVPIAVTGQPIGSLVVEVDETRQTPQTIELVNIVARQVAQQVENLRLLESAERYRFEAEESARRLTREGWEEYFSTKANQSLSYLYDLQEVRTSDQGTLPEDSALAIPIKVRDETIGKLAVFGLESADAETMELINTVSERLSEHIEGLRLLEETQLGQLELNRRAEQLAAVSEISTISSRELDVQKMLATVVHLTQRRFGLYHAHIFTYNEAAKMLEIVACGYREGDEHEGTHGTTVIPIDQEQSLVARAARSRTPVVVNDVRSDPGWLPNPLLPDTVSELAVPLVIGDDVLGVLDVQSEHLNAFSDEDVSIQATLAAQVATALQNARSFARAQRQAEREAMLNAISQKIQSATSVEAVLQIAARELGHALGAPRTIAQLSMKDNK